MRQVINRLVKFCAQKKIKNRGWKEINRLIKFVSKLYLCKGIGEMINRTIKTESELDVGERGWKVVNWMIEIGHGS